jgi:hypothetical protein
MELNDWKGIREKAGELMVKRVKLSLCFTIEALCHEGVWGNICIDPHILDTKAYITK